MTKSQTDKIGEEKGRIRSRKKSSIYGLLELRYVSFFFFFLKKKLRYIVGERNMVCNGTCNLAKREEEDGYVKKKEENMREREKVLFNKLKE